MESTTWLRVPGTETRHDILVLQDPRLRQCDLRTSKTRPIIVATALYYNVVGNRRLDHDEVTMPRYLLMYDCTSLCCLHLRTWQIVLVKSTKHYIIKNGTIHNKASRLQKIISNFNMKKKKKRKGTSIKISTYFRNV